MMMLSQDQTDWIRKRRKTHVERSLSDVASTVHDLEDNFARALRCVSAFVQYLRYFHNLDLLVLAI